MKVVVVDEGGKAVVADNLWPPVPEAHVLVQVYTAVFDPQDDQAKRELSDADAAVRPGSCFAGIVAQIGPACTRHELQEGTPVVGILGALDTCGALAEYIVAPEFSVVLKPESLSFAQAAALVPGALLAYIALQFRTRVDSGDTVLIPAGARAKAHVAMQLAHHWGAKVACTAHKLQEALYLQSMASHCTLIDLSDSPESFAFHADEFTSGVGFDVVMQCDAAAGAISVVTITNALGVQALWATSIPPAKVGATLQAALFAKSVAIAHVNAVAVVSGASMQGRILHVLRDALKLGAEGTVHANITQELSLADAASVINGDTVLPAVGIAVVRVAQEPAA